MAGGTFPHFLETWGIFLSRPLDPIEKIGLHHSIRRKISAGVSEPLRKLNSLDAKSYFRKTALRYFSTPYCLRRIYFASFSDGERLCSSKSTKFRSTTLRRAIFAILAANRITIIHQRKLIVWLSVI